MDKTIKRCEHCQEMFAADLTGMLSIMCRPCASDCEQSYMKVYRYIREKQTQQQPVDLRDLKLISEETNVPVLFVRALVENGKFGRVPSEEERHCKKCNISLKDLEKVFCTSCARSVTQDVAQSAMDRHSPPPPHQPDSYRGRYGLKRWDD